MEYGVQQANLFRRLRDKCIASAEHLHQVTFSYRLLKQPYVPPSFRSHNNLTLELLYASAVFVFFLQIYFRCETMEHYSLKGKYAVVTGAGSGK